MSNGNGCGCGCNDQVPPCNPTLPQQESVASQLANLQLFLFGVFTVTVVNGRGVWTGLCNYASIVAGIPQLINEGLICYCLRLLGYLFTGQGPGSFTPTVQSAAALLTVPTAGNQKTLGICIPVMNLITPGQLAFVQLIPGNAGGYLPADYNSSTNNVSWKHVL